MICCTVKDYFKLVIIGKTFKLLNETQGKEDQLSWTKHYCEVIEMWLSGGYVESVSMFVMACIDKQMGTLIKSNITCSYTLIDNDIPKL